MGQIKGTKQVGGGGIEWARIEGSENSRETKFEKNKVNEKQDRV